MVNFVDTLTRDSDRSTAALLNAALTVSVPMWVDRVRGYSVAYRSERLDFCSRMIAEHGDDILFRSKRKGATASAFNALAEGIAILSFAPGGVKVFGGHWETKSLDDLADESDYYVDDPSAE